MVTVLRVVLVIVVLPCVFLFTIKTSSGISLMNTDSGVSTNVISSSTLMLGAKIRWNNLLFL
jgi:hypothetical protein